MSCNMVARNFDEGKIIFFFFFLNLDNIISIKRLITLTGREINVSNENMIMKHR